MSWAEQEFEVTFDLHVTKRVAVEAGPHAPVSELHQVAGGMAEEWLKELLGYSTADNFNIDFTEVNAL